MMSSILATPRPTGSVRRHVLYVGFVPLIDAAPLIVGSELGYFTDELHRGVLDGFCVGEPWNTLAVHQGYGTIIRESTELAPNNPEKVLAVTRKWYDQHRAAAEGLVRATLRGCDYCQEESNRDRLTEILAAPKYLDVAEAVIHKSLSIDDWLRPGRGRPRFRSYARSGTSPDRKSVEWTMRQMMRWGQLPRNSNLKRIIDQSIMPDAYAKAVGDMKASLQASV